VTDGVEGVVEGEWVEGVEIARNVTEESSSDDKGAHLNES